MRTIVYYCAGIPLVLSVLTYLALTSLGVELQSARKSSSATMLGVSYDVGVGATAAELTYGNLAAPVRRPDQLLIRVHAASVNPVDFKMRRAKLPQWLVRAGRKIPGADIAGIVLEVPRGSRFRVGDRVAAMMPVVFTHWGASAELAAVNEAHVALIPAGIRFVDAAALPLIALTVVQGFEGADLYGDDAAPVKQRLLVQAGAGGVGTFAIQWASAVLGMEVEASCSPASAALVTSLGASRTIDYHNESALWGAASAQRYDVIFDPMSHRYEARTLQPHFAAAAPAAASILRRAGIYLGVMSSDWSLDAEGEEVANDSSTMLRALRSWVLRTLGGNRAAAGAVVPRHRVVAVRPDGETLQRVLDRVAAGEIRAVVDKIFPLRDAAKAHEYLERGHAKGKVILEIIAEG